MRPSTIFAAIAGGFAYLLIFMIGLGHGLYPTLTVGDSLRTLIGSAAPFAFSFSRLSRRWCDAVIEATIPYQEPPYWYYPVGQSLGAALLAAGKADDARDAFRAALLRGPGNAWALWGLARAEAALGHTLESRAADAAFERAWLGGKTLPELDRL